MKAGAASKLFLVAAYSIGRAVAEDSGPLPVVPGAEQVTTRTGRGTTTVEFDVREPYPALKTIDYLMKALAERGWKAALPSTFESPGRDAARVPVAELHRGHHIWEGRWRDAAGNEIVYRVAYDCPLEQYGMHSVYAHTSGARYGKVEAKKREAERQQVDAERRQTREAFCFDLPRSKVPGAARLFCE